MIYFDAPDQEKVLKNIHKSMNKNGILILGESESLNGLQVPFKFLAPQIYQESEG